MTNAIGTIALALIVGAFVLVASWMIGSAVHADQEQRQQFIIECAKTNGQAIDTKGGWTCVK